MKDTKDVRSWLETALEDKDLAAQILEAAEARGKAIEDAGVDFKAEGDVTPAPAPVTAPAPTQVAPEIAALKSEIAQLEAKITALTGNVQQAVTEEKSAEEAPYSLAEAQKQIEALTGVVTSLEGFIREKFSKSSRASRSTKTAVDQQDAQLQALLKNNEPPEESYLGQLVKSAFANGASVAATPEGSK